jgi:protein TonB
MFASVRETPRRRFGTGAILSLAAHAAVVAIALLLSPSPRSDDRSKSPEIRIVTLAPRPAPAAAAGAQEPPKRTASTPPRRSNERPIQKPQPREPLDSSSGVPAPAQAPTSGGTGTSDSTPRGSAPGIPDGLGTTTPVSGDEAIEIRAGMVAPRLVAKTEVTYSAKAWAMKIGGVALARCTIELDGTLSDCRITRPLPYMDDAILEALRAWRYTPVFYQGHPQRVIMTIPIRVATPR